MSKWRQIIKTRKLKIHKDPVKRLARITELKRHIKFYKSVVEDNRKNMVNAQRAAISAEYHYNMILNEIKKYEAELNELEGVNNG